MDTRKYLQLRLPNAIHHQLKRRALDEGRSMIEWVTSAILDALAREPSSGSISAREAKGELAPGSLDAYVRLTEEREQS